MSWFKYGKSEGQNPGRTYLKICISDDAERAEVEGEIGKRACERLVVSAGDMPDLSFLATCMPQGPNVLLIQGGVESLSGIDKLTNLTDFKCDLESGKPLPQFGTLVHLERCWLAWIKGYDAKSCDHRLFTLPKLRDLTLRFWSKPDCTEIAQLPSLEKLDLRQGAVTSLEGLQHRSGLRHLSLAYLSKLKNFDAIGEHRALEGLEIAKCPGFADITLLGSLPQLRILNLQSIVAQIPSLDWMKGLKRLEDVMIATEIASLDWAIPFGLPALKRIVLRSHAGYALSDADILAIAKAAGRNVVEFSRIGTKKVPSFYIILE